MIERSITLCNQRYQLCVDNEEVPAPSHDNVSEAGKKDDEMEEEKELVQEDEDCVADDAQADEPPRKVARSHKPAAKAMNKAGKSKKTAAVQDVQNTTPDDKAASVPCASAGILVRSLMMPRNYMQLNWPECRVSQ